MFQHNLILYKLYYNVLMIQKKWTLEYSTEFASNVLKYVREHEDCYVLGEAIVACGSYSEIISYLNKQYGEFEDLIIAKETIKNRCLKGGMTGKLTPAMTIFNLVNNFDMVNTNTKSDITTKGKAIQSIPSIKWTD